MQVVDFGRSFLSWRVDLQKRPLVTVSRPVCYTLNTARVPIESRCEIVEKRAGQAEEFVLSANCKSEDVGVQRGIWMEPNADFRTVFSRTRFLNLKSYDKANKGVMLYPPSLGPQPERQVGVLAEAYDAGWYTLRYREGQVLETKDAMIETILAEVPLMGRTRIENARYTATIEYPINTVSANPREYIYQPDTGPALFPDLTREPDDLIAGFELAFIAFNSPDWAEFIVRVPTPIAEGISVYHYSRPVGMAARNEIMALPG